MFGWSETVPNHWTSRMLRSSVRKAIGGRNTVRVVRHRRWQCLARANLACKYFRLLSLTAGPRLCYFYGLSLVSYAAFELWIIKQRWRSVRVLSMTRCGRLLLLHLKILAILFDRAGDVLSESSHEIEHSHERVVGSDCRRWFGRLIFHGAWCFADCWVYHCATLIMFLFVHKLALCNKSTLTGLVRVRPYIWTCIRPIINDNSIFI